MFQRVLLAWILGLVVMVSCKKEDTTPNNNSNSSNNNNNTTSSDKRDMAVGRYDCKQYVYTKAGAMLTLTDSAAYEIEIKKHASDTTKIEIYKGSQLLFNTSNVKYLTGNNKVITFDIPSQDYTYQGTARPSSGEPYFFTGSGYTHGGYIDSTKVCQFAINHAADSPGFSIVHRFNCTKK